MKKSAPWSQAKVMTGAFLLCFFVAGIPFWLTPYSRVTVPNSFLGIGAIAVVSVAAVLAFRFGFRKGLFVPASVFPAVLMVRVVVEGMMEPTRHNLWPLALVVTIVLGLVVAGAGAALGRLAYRIHR